MPNRKSVRKSRKKSLRYGHIQKKKGIINKNV